MKGGLVVICGPSGVGKDTMIDKLPMFLEENDCYRVGTLTTRPFTANHDPSYKVVSNEEFSRRVSKGQWIQNSQPSGLYATSIDEINDEISKDKICIHSVFPSSENIGALRHFLKEKLLSIALIPPGETYHEQESIIRERLISRNRGGDNIEDRLSYFREIMLYILSNPMVQNEDGSKYQVFDAVVENKNIEECLQEIVQTIRNYFTKYDNV